MLEPTAKNNKVKYAWYRYRGYSPGQAKLLAQRTETPQEFYDDLEKWFFYQNGQLELDPTDGEINKSIKSLEFFSKKS